MEKQVFTVTELGYTIELALEIIGADFLITLTGGSHPHIGTVTTYSKELAKKQTVRFPSHSGRFHKDDVLADVLLEQIQDILPQNCVITSGVHVDGISKEQIQASFGMVKQLGQDLTVWLKEHPLEVSSPTYYKNGGQYEET